MSWSLITNAAKRGAISTAATTVTTAANTTGADLLVVALSVFNTTTGSLTDSSSNTWTQAVTSGVGAGSINIKVFYCQNPTTNASHTFTLTTSGTTFPAIAMDAFSGSGAGGSDQTNHNATASAGSLQPGSITPTLNNELIYNVLSFNTTTLPTISAGAITNNLVAIGGTADGIASAWLAQTLATATNPTWTTAAATTSCACQVSFFAPAAAGTLFGLSTLDGLSTSGPKQFNRVS